jgi:RNA polymerase primary sigma factor
MSDTRSQFLNALDAAVGDLSEQEARIVRLRYTVEGSWPMTLEEVGRVEGMTREQVREIEERAFEKLQAHGFDLEPS